MSSSLPEPITLKLERATVLADGADGAFVKALWPPGADLQRDLDVAAKSAGVRRSVVSLTTIANATYERLRSIEQALRAQ